MPKEQMTIRLYPETRRRMDSWLEESNSKNRNEFVEKALRFYMGYLGAEDITEYLSDALVAALRGIIADTAESRQIAKNSSSPMPTKRRCTPR